MPRMTALGVLSTAILLSGCATNGTASSSDASSISASAALADATGASRGTATLSETADGVRLVVDGSGLAPGAHGLHVHTVGRCDAPDFATAGPHWNPTGKMHGRDNPAGLHLGDLPNLIVGSDGRGRLEAMLPKTKLTGGSMPLLDADGAAIVVHAAADDYKTDPSGNSGARVACGVFAGA